MGLPLNEPSSPKYFLGLVAMVLIVGAVVLAGGYGAMQLTSGPCDELYDQALGGLEAEVDFLKESGDAIGVNKVEAQELRTSTQVAGDSLETCCEQRAAIGAENFAQCEQKAARMAAMPAELIAAHGEPSEAKKAVRKAANELRGIASDLVDIANSGAAGAASGVAAGPPEGASGTE
jgi:hypothetical protein